MITLTFAAIQFCFFTRLPWSFYHSIGQGISAVGAFFELLSQPSLSVQHPEENKQVAPAELCPILKRLYRILIKRFVLCIITSSLLTTVQTPLLTYSFYCFHFTLLIRYRPDLCAGSSQQGTFFKPWGTKRWMILGKGLRWHKAMHSTARLSLENHDLVSPVD